MLKKVHSPKELLKLVQEKKKKTKVNWFYHILNNRKRFEETSLRMLTKNLIPKYVTKFWLPLHVWQKIVVLSRYSSLASKLTNSIELTWQSNIDDYNLKPSVRTQCFNHILQSDFGHCTICT